MTGTLEGELFALADASTDAEDIEEDVCHAWGPHNGQCYLNRGHRDVAQQGLHVTFDNDHYQEWPVGWRSAEARVAAVIDSGFGCTVNGAHDDSEYARGFADALTLVRKELRPVNPRRR